ncbi:MAG: ABC transporter permease subunit [Planctomycetes bacterium]|nr:ABC transporter permease subunit [Planctomycetota bacterium]
MTNPIIQRELISVLRQPRAWAIQLIFAAALCLLVLTVWPDSATVNLGGRQAQQLLSVFVYGLLVGLILMAPAFPAMAIVRERQQGTLTLLLTSPLTPTDILLGKISAALGFVALLLILSLPGAAACFVMGGVAIEQLAWVYAVLALVAAQYALLALFISARVKSTDAALRITYGLILVMCVFTLGPNLMLQGKMTGPMAPIGDAAQWLASVSPLPAVMHLVGHESVGSRGLAATDDPVTQYALLAALSIVAFAIGTHMKLRPMVTDRPRSKGMITDDMDKRVRRRRRMLFLVDPNRRSGSIANYENPVMMKEFRTRTFGRAHWMIRIVGSCLIVSLALMLVATMGTMWVQTSYMGGVLVIFQMGLIVLVTPALSAAVISSELESGGWVLLQMTPLRARQIVVGKLLSVAWTLTLILLATLPGYAVLLVIDEGRKGQVQEVLISLTLTSLFCLLVGAACSGLFRKTTAATTTAYLIVVSLCVVTLLPWLGEGTLFGRDFVEAALTLNPLAAGLAAMHMPGMDQYNLTPINWYFLGIGSAIAAALLWIRTWELTKPR